jgi:hypothetical protein
MGEGEDGRGGENGRGGEWGTKRYSVQLSGTLSNSVIKKNEYNKYHCNETNQPS